MSAPEFKFWQDWDRWDTAAISAALHRSHAEHLKTNHPIALMSNPTVAYHRLVTGEQTALTVDGYLVVYSVGPLWSGTVSVVNELYVLALRRTPGNLRNVVRALMAVAEASNSFGVAVGNASGDSRLSRFYEAQGFVSTGTQFFKEL